MLPAASSNARRLSFIELASCNVMSYDVASNICQADV